MSRTRKRAYTGSKRFDSSCRCHGGCDWCRNNRLHRDQRDRGAANQQLRDFKHVDSN